MTGTAATKVTAAESVGAAETVGRKKMRETAETVAEEEKAYIHWLYQAVGVGSRGFLRSLATLGTPREFSAPTST